MKKSIIAVLVLLVCLYVFTGAEPDIHGAAESASAEAKPDLTAAQPSVIAQSRALNLSDNGQHQGTYLVDEPGWCIAWEDLQQRDIPVARHEFNERYTAKKYARLMTPEQFDALGAEPNEQQQFLLPYIEENEQTLVKLTSQGDFWAATALVQRRDVNQASRNYASDQLIYNGYTAHGLQQLIIRGLVNAGTAYKKDASLLTLKGAVVEALAYVEIGLERQEAFALQAYSTAIQELEKQTGVKVSQLLTETDEQAIDLLRQGMIEKIDSYRYEKGLSAFMDIDKDPIAQALFNRDLANFKLTNKRFNQERADFRYLNKKFKLDNDCVTRWLTLYGV